MWPLFDSIMWARENTPPMFACTLLSRLTVFFNSQNMQNYSCMQWTYHISNAATETMFQHLHTTVWHGDSYTMKSSYQVSSASNLNLKWLTVEAALHFYKKILERWQTSRLLFALNFAYFWICTDWTQSFQLLLLGNVLSRWHWNLVLDKALWTIHRAKVAQWWDSCLTSRRFWIRLCLLLPGWVVSGGEPKQLCQITSPRIPLWPSIKHG